MERLEKLDVNIDAEYLYTEESTSDGSQIKFCRDGFWYKIDNKGGEGVAEYLASLVLESSNLNPIEYVSYGEAVINGKDGCYSKSCTTDGETLVSIYRLWANIHGGDIGTYLSTMDYDDAIEYVIRFVKEFTKLDVRKYLANNIAFSMIIRNEDLHFNNLWVIYDGESYREAPIMDNGRSLLVGDINDDISIERRLAEHYSKIFSKSFEQNYRYLKDSCTLKINKEKLLGSLSLERDTLQKKVLLLQIERYPDIIL